jgi:NAD(P)-dependent dehydrogenase (short-subunit alcohol dehydrogenase family)
MAKKRWSYVDIPILEGKVSLITGANSGLGLQATHFLSDKGAEIVMAVRNVEKGEKAATDILRRSPSARLSVIQANLADLQSIQRLSRQFLEQYKRLDGLINNAGIMANPYQLTKDGFEMQFGTNHLGHFALTGLLMPVIRNTPGARVVTMSSSYHEGGTIDFANLDGRNGYDGMKVYKQSKLANLLFAIELQRRFVKNGLDALSIGAYPGYSRTSLHLKGPEMEGSSLRLMLSKLLYVLFAQSAEMGVLPMLYAAVSPDVKGGDYIGPSSFSGMRGYPTLAQASKLARDKQLSRRLWEVSEQLTQIRYL